MRFAQPRENALVPSPVEWYFDCHLTGLPSYPSIIHGSVRSSFKVIRRLASTWSILLSMPRLPADRCGHFIKNHSVALSGKSLFHHQWPLVAVEYPLSLPSSDFGRLGLSSDLWMAFFLLSQHPSKALSLKFYVASDQSKKRKQRKIDLWPDLPAESQIGFSYFPSWIFL